MYRNLNQTQSHEITCSSRYLQGSIYHRKSDKSNQMDIIHCEASTDVFQSLSLYSYYHAKGDGIKSLSSPGSCIISEATNCIRLILYLNLSYYDHHHDDASTIPVCAFTRASDNSECFCIQYNILGEPDIT